MIRALLSTPHDRDPAMFEGAIRRRSAAPAAAG
jgi:hypothetical protein